MINIDLVKIKIYTVLQNWDFANSYLMIRVGGKKKRKALDEITGFKDSKASKIFQDSPLGESG